MSKDWSAICDRCGFEFKASELRETWDGLRVCKADWERRHDLDFLRGRQEDQTVPWSRPEGTDGGGTDIAGKTITHLAPTRVTGNQTLTVGTDHQVQEWNTDLTSNVTITLDTTGAIAGNTFQIYRTDTSSSYTIDIGGLKTSDTGINFYAVVEFDGSAWQLKSYTPTELASI